VNPAPADIADRDDISRLVAEFDRRVFTGELLGPVFVDVARVDRACHDNRVSHGWTKIGSA
jgi:hypothetical protein